ncbi:protein D3-like isoform X2 [Diabrotica virgifera virgifera]|uniref:Protein D3-like n=1 Tax=Diabrotica virgifera virgifera TaxID=50390 RepID=A0ABM5L0J1_DIAVI|nr:protein D3-like isoform X2 [Diabrotica virgifera virgifera]
MQIYLFYLFYMVEVNKAFKINKVYPDVVSAVPDKLLHVTYKADNKVELGNELTPTQVIEQPKVTYEGDNNCFYTLIFTDPDAPSRYNPIYREYIHWLVVNIPGSKIFQGETISDYVGSAPLKGSGLHRYVFLLYKQPEKLKFDEPKHSPTDGNRGNFNIENFAKKYKLGNPIAGNFYQAMWDDSVPASRKKLGI